MVTVVKNYSRIFALNYCDPGLVVVNGTGYNVVPGLL